MQLIIPATMIIGGCIIEKLIKQMKKISTENLNLIPNPKDLQKLCKSISALEAIICPDWEFRYYSYQKDWGVNEECFEMRSGQGDHMLILFSNKGTCINGFAYKSEMNGWKYEPIKKQKSLINKLLGLRKESKTELIQEIKRGVVTELPEVFKEFVFGEPVKSIGTTFCIWNTENESGWKTGKIEFPNDEYKDGSEHILHLLNANPLSYKEWAEERYQEELKNRELQLTFIEKIYSGISVTRELVLQFNPNFKEFEKLKNDLNEIGFDNEI